MHTSLRAVAGAISLAIATPVYALYSPLALAQTEPTPPPINVVAPGPNINPITPPLETKLTPPPLPDGGDVRPRINQENTLFDKRPEEIKNFDQGMNPPNNYSNGNSQPFDRRPSDLGGQRGYEPNQNGFDPGQNEQNDDEQNNREEQEQKRRLADMKRGLRGLEQGIKMYEKQIAKLSKQKIAAPTELVENIAKAKTLIDSIKNATSPDELENIDFNDVQEIMQELEQSRQQLEMLSRWPQTLRQVDKQISFLNKELKRNKGIVDRLAKKEIDLSQVYSKFELAVKTLKDVRDTAADKVKEGDAEEAFNTLESDFFGQMEETMQYQKVIQTMANLGRFSIEFKKNMTMAEKTIKSLERKKKDVSALKDLLSQAKSKGEEVLTAIKSGEVDEESAMSALSELEDVRRQFEEKIDEITGEEDVMPWEKGSQAFKKVETPISFKKFFKVDRAIATQ